MENKINISEDDTRGHLLPTDDDTPEDRRARAVGDAGDAGDAGDEGDEKRSPM